MIYLNPRCNPAVNLSHPTLMKKCTSAQSHYIHIYTGLHIYKSHTPHCRGHHDQKVDTEGKFYVIWFVMVNALIWCNFEKKSAWLLLRWSNLSNRISTWTGSRIFLKGQKMQFLQLSNFSRILIRRRPDDCEILQELRSMDSYIQIFFWSIISIAWNPTNSGT